MEFIIYMILKHLFRIDLSTFPPCIFSRNLHKYLIYNFGIIYRYLVHEQVTNLNIHLFAIYEIHYFFLFNCNYTNFYKSDISSQKMLKGN